MANFVPYIPDNAPFSPDQRSWLNGFLAGLYSNAPGTAVVAEPQASLKIAVLFASQSGTGEGLAKKVAKELKAKGHVPTIASLDTFAPEKLAAEEHALVIASTYGEGDPPDGTKGFYDLLCADTAPRMEKLTYSVLALGDKHYEHFCKFGLDLDERLQSLGATRLAEPVECDVEVAEPFALWKADMLARFDALAAGGKALDAGRINGNGASAHPAPAKVVVPERVHVHTRDNPLIAPLVERRALTHEISSKLTVHLAFSIADSQLHYEAGDACGVIAQNDPALMHEILDALKLGGDEIVKLDKKGETTLRQALLHDLVITRLSRKIVQSYATLGQVGMLLGLLVPEQQTHLDKYTYDRGVIDLLVEYPGVIKTASELVAMLPKLTPRLYSISSSPAAHAGEVHNTVAVVRYRSHNRDRGGICSTMLSERTAVGERLPIYIQPNKKFRLPTDPVAPVIMIGPGTGIAPFRGFLHERRALGEKGKNWLFFGDRSAATDFLYREELESMVADQHLTRLDTAFSRDQEHKVYVQDKMIEHAAQFWGWMQEGASIYVCGDASRMAKDVDSALLTIVEKQGGMDREAASDWVQTLKDDHRYHRDVY